MQANCDIDLYLKLLVGRYLADGGYSDTLDRFAHECGLGLETIESYDFAGESLQKIVQDRVGFAEAELANKLKQCGLGGQAAVSCHGLPSWGYSRCELALSECQMQYSGLVVSSFFCPVSQEVVLSRFGQVAVFDSQFRQTRVLETLKDARSLASVCGTIAGLSMYFTCGMDGWLKLFDRAGHQIVECKWKLHEKSIKYARLISTHNKPNSFYFISCCRDNYLKIHLLEINDTSNGGTLTFICETKLSTNVTAFEVAVLNNPDKTVPVVFLGKLDHSNMSVFSMINEKLLQICDVALNTAQFMTRSFGISDMALLNVEKSPTGTPILDENTQIVVATSHSPYIRFLLVETPFSTLEQAGSLRGNTCQTLYNKVLHNMSSEIEQNSFYQISLKLMPDCQSLVVASESGLFAIDMKGNKSWRLDLQGQTDWQNAKVKNLLVCNSINKLVVCTYGKKVDCYDINSTIK